jgi:anti-anti-sigma factor
MDPRVSKSPYEQLDPAHPNTSASPEPFGDLNMAIKHSRENGVLDIQLEGRIDRSGTPEFLDDFDTVITADDPAMVLNMRRLEYINSAGMRAILELVTKLQRQDAKFAIYSPIGPVKDVF